jgi:hypothetical protein
MRNYVSGLKSLILVTCCVVNGRFFLPNAVKALQTFCGLHGLSNTQRRVLQMGDWYRVILALENEIPLKATVRLVSPAPPWYPVYYLYPRLLKKGSEVLSDQEAIRAKYPDDWVLVYAEDPPQAKTFPPLKDGHL